jgi:hypothetical protein
MWSHVRASSWQQYAFPGAGDAGQPSQLGVHDLVARARVAAPDDERVVDRQRDDAPVQQAQQHALGEVGVAPLQPESGPGTEAGRDRPVPGLDRLEQICCVERRAGSG